MDAHANAATEHGHGDGHGAGHGDAHGHGHGGHGVEDFHPHVMPLLIYIGTWLGLMVLTAVTVGVSYIDLGSLNLLIAMLVATL
jgi:cytochrome c oxidase subunit IV